MITRHGASAAELIRARKPRVPLEELKASAPPPPDGVLAPMDADALRDWRAL